MELLGIFYVSNFLLITLLFLLSIYLYGRRHFSFFSKHGIKGPKPTAFLGNLIEISHMGFAHIFFKWQKKFGDNYGFFLGSFPNLVIGEPEIIGQIIVKQYPNFLNRRLAFPLDDYSKKMVSFSKDEHWKYLRSVLSPSYSSRKMREMSPLIENALNSFEKNLERIADSNKATDIIILFSGYTMDVIASTGFGIQVDSQENPDSPLVKNARKVFNVDYFTSLQSLAVVFPFVATIANWFKKGVFFSNLTYFVEFCKELIKERKQEECNGARKDLLQLMLDAQLEDHEMLGQKTDEILLENVTDWRTKRGLTDDEIIAQCMIFLVAGFDTTAITLSFFSHSLATNPDVQEKLYQEIVQLGTESPNYDNVQKLTYLEMCMEETLRMYPIGFMLTRECKEDCIINGQKIPKNSGIIISTMALHYDPRYWTEPEKFDPERFTKENKAKQTPFTYLPFGDGPRICPGMRLATLELKMAVVRMLRKFRLVACDKTEKKIEFAKSNLLKPKGAIWIKIERR